MSNDFTHPVTTLECKIGTYFANLLRPSNLVDGRPPRRIVEMAWRARCRYNALYATLNAETKVMFRRELLSRTSPLNPFVMD